MENNKQTKILDVADARSTGGVRCTVCGKSLSNPLSVRVEIGPVCRSKLFREEKEDLELEDLPSIDKNFIDKIEYWGSLLYDHLHNEEDKKLVDNFISKAKASLYMSTVVIAAEADMALELYRRLGIRRDDIMMGLQQIVLATGRKVGGL